MFLASDGVMAEAVINAFDQLGMLFPVGHEKHIIVTAVDGTPAVIDLIKDGYVDATCAPVSYTHLDVYKRQKQSYTVSIRRQSTKGSNCKMLGDWSGSIIAG